MPILLGAEMSRNPVRYSFSIAVRGFLDLSVSSSSWCLGGAAVCGCTWLSLDFSLTFFFHT